jgi:hypothetical protein
MSYLHVASQHSPVASQHSWWADILSSTLPPHWVLLLHGQVSLEGDWHPVRGPHCVPSWPHHPIEVLCHHQCSSPLLCKKYCCLWGTEPLLWLPWSIRSMYYVPRSTRVFTTFALHCITSTLCPNSLPNDATTCEESTETMMRAGASQREWRQLQSVLFSLSTSPSSATLYSPLPHQRLWSYNSMNCKDW